MRQRCFQCRQLRGTPNEAPPTGCGECVASRSACPDWASISLRLVRITTPYLCSASTSWRSRSRGSPGARFARRPEAWMCPSVAASVHVTRRVARRGRSWDRSHHIWRCASGWVGRAHLLRIARRRWRHPHLNRRPGFCRARIPAEYACTGRGRCAAARRASLPELIDSNRRAYDQLDESSCQQISS